MTTTSVLEPRSSAAAIGARRGRGPAGLAAWPAWLPAAAGAAYLAAWVGGLAAWPVNLPLNATAAQKTASYLAHPAQAVIQYLLVEGLAGLMLGIVLGCALLPRLGGGNALRGGGASCPARWPSGFPSRNALSGSSSPARRPAMTSAAVATCPIW